jgi:hypothetical protein
MIRFKAKYGRKVIFADVFKNYEATGVGTQQYLPNSQHFELQNTMYALYIENIVTKSKANIGLTYEGENSRGVYFSFEMGKDGLDFTELGTYKYTINATTSSQQIDKDFELDRGLFHIINNDTFTEPYIKPDVEVIPATKVYKPN